jgi:hypothetical protein
MCELARKLADLDPTESGYDRAISGVDYGEACKPPDDAEGLTDGEIETCSMASGTEPRTL